MDDDDDDDDVINKDANDDADDYAYEINSDNENVVFFSARRLKQ